MISLKKYLDTISPALEAPAVHDLENILSLTLAAYQSALLEMGICSLDACPALGLQLKQGLGEVEESLSMGMSGEEVHAADRKVRERLKEWGTSTASHYRQKTGEVRELLIAMARTAEAVGERDQRCAGQIRDVTARLESIVNLEDLTEIRASIENSAAELKTSIERMATEGKAAVAELKAEVSSYQIKLEHAEAIALRDALTGLCNRLALESSIKKAIAAGAPFCVAMLDLDGFKHVNDEHGHMVGDELLKKFSAELKSACRSSDVIGRWGGDEFILLLICNLREAGSHIERLKEWVCGNYTVNGRYYPMILNVKASIGLAEHKPGEAAAELVARADEAMYLSKVSVRPA